MHLVPVDIQAGGEALKAFVHQGTCPARGGIGPVGLDLGLQVELVQTAHGGRRRVRATRVLEKGPALEGGFREGGKLVANEVEVELGHLSSLVPPNRQA
jgi:hypothetical protein